MDGWHRLDDLDPIGVEPVAVPVPGTEQRVLLVRTVDGVLHATAPACPHLGQPLTLGTVDGSVIECRHHFYRYDLTDGRCEDATNRLAGRLTVHAVREDADGVHVRLTPDDPAPAGDPTRPDVGDGT